jgi:hypothetical protein
MERGLFGRQTELALVSRLLDAVPSGPAALILGGEAGIGKSTLGSDGQFARAGTHFEAGGKMA